MKIAKLLVGCSLFILVPNALYGGYLREEYPSFSEWGGAGLIQTRTARFMEEGYFNVGFAHTYPNNNINTTFQAFPWLETTFRYVIIQDWNRTHKKNYDRSLDFKFKLLKERAWIPQLALGFQDTLGTMRFRGEYLVASKRFGDFDLSLGLGWGKNGSRAIFENPLSVFSKAFKAKRTGKTGLGGKFSPKDYFRGRTAPFGGLEYHTPIRGLNLKLEYSGDKQIPERTSRRFKYRTPVNIGASYQHKDWLVLGASLENGHQIGFNISLVMDFKKKRPYIDKDAPAVKAREMQEESIFQDQEINMPCNASHHENENDDRLIVYEKPAVKNSLPKMNKTLPVKQSVPYEAIFKEGDALGIPVKAINFEGEKTAVVYIEILRYRTIGRAVGRIARMLTHFMPNHIESFKIVVTEKELNMSSYTIQRYKLEQSLNFDVSTEELWDKAGFENTSFNIPETAIYNRRRPYSFYAIPRIKHSFFDPHNPYRYQVNLAPGGEIRFGRGVYLGGELGLKLLGNLDTIRRESNSTLPHVRSDVKQYSRKGQYGLSSLQFDWLSQLSPTIYTRVSTGYFEQMYGGISGEILYHDFNNRWALGADINKVWKRDFNGRLGFRRYTTFTGLVSFYYEVPFYDLVSAVHVGRYLAKDVGATFEIAKRFETGITLGCFFTRTNVSAAKFGEGSFDKGIFFSIPLDYIMPLPSSYNFGTAIRPLTRDGGQMVGVSNRLYGLTARHKRGEMVKDFRDFWN
jgi:hypothetical protein